MCVAIACPEKFPDAETIISCADANPDGGGVAWVEEGKVLWIKGIDGKDANKLIREGKIKPPALIHFRIATAGGTRPELCHPFPISRSASTDCSGSANQVLIHNGHWGSWAGKALNIAMKHDKGVPGGYWSDSRTLAYMAYHLGESSLRLVEGQKIATLDKDGAIRLFGRFEQRDGISYSNMNWKTSVYVVTGRLEDNESATRWNKRWSRTLGYGKSGQNYDTSYACGDGRGAKAVAEAWADRKALVAITKDEDEHLSKVEKNIGRLTIGEASVILKKKRENKQKLTKEEESWDWLMENFPEETGEMLKTGMGLEEMVECMRNDIKAGVM